MSPNRTLPNDDEPEQPIPTTATVAPWPYPTWIAHRGAGRLAPENTLAAFRAGAALGWKAFECDVKLSADGVPFLLHDDTLERTTDAAGSAGDLSWGDLARLDAGGWHSRTHAGEPLASLDAIAAFCLRNGYLLNLELKPAPGDEERTGQVVAQTVRQRWGEAVRDGLSVWPLLSSFEPRTLAAAREAVPELPRALLLDALAPDCFYIAERLDCVAVILEESLVTRELVRALHHDGLRVLAYTVNEASRAELLLELGLDGLITDAVDTFVPGP
jgi:glycerophosphoryl diester phosphodiesterase